MTELIKVKDMRIKLGRKVIGEWLLDPRTAVIAAYAQDRGDYDTWNYEARYGALVRTGQFHVFCGPMAAPTYSLKAPD